MSGAIKAGDLVIVVATHCDESILGRIVPVDSVGAYPNCWCTHCNSHVSGPIAMLNGQWWGVPTRWLKRIPPLEELEDVKQDEEITA